MEDDELNINELFLQPTKTMPSLTAEAETAVANGKKYNTRTQLWDLDQETEYGFGDTFTAMQQEGASIYSMASRSMDVDDGEFDESFSFTEDIIADYFKTVPEGHHDYLFQSGSKHELDQRMEQVKLTMKNREVIAETFDDSPFTTALAMITSAVVTPETLALNAIPMAGTALSGMKATAAAGKNIKTLMASISASTQGASRLGTAGKYAAISGAEGTLTGIYASQVLPDYDAYDIMVDATASTMFGGLVGTIGHKVRKAADDSRQYAVDTAIAGGAEEVPAIRNSLEAEDTFTPKNTIDNENPAEQGKIFGGWINNITSQGAYLRSSKNPIVKNLVNIMVHNNRADNVGGTNIQGTSAIQTKLSRSSRVKLANSMVPEFAQWRVNNKRRRGIKSEGDFEILVTKAVRSDEVYKNSPMEVQRAADNAREVFKDLLEKKKYYKVLGAKDVEYNRNYVPTDWDSAKLRATIDEYDADSVAKILGQSISARNGWDLAFSTRIGSLFSRSVASLDTGIRGSNLEELFEDMSEMRAFLVKSGMTEAEIDAGMSATITKNSTNPKKSPDVNMRKRLDMDYETEFTAGNLTMTVSDLLNNNMTDIVQSYSHKSGRHIGLARNGIGGEGMPDFEGAILKIEDYALRNNLDPKQTSNEIEHLRNLLEALKGSELMNSKAFGINKGKYQTLQNSRDLAYLAFSDWFGAMSIIESANLTGYLGFKTLFKVIPEHRDWLRKARNGEGSNSDMQAINDAAGTGAGGFTGAGSTRMDEIGGMAEYMTPWWQKARQIQGNLSLLTPITDFFQRLNAAMMRKLWVEGTIHKTILRDTGVTPEMYNRIQAQIKKHGDGERSMGFDKWDDRDASEVFTNHIAIETRNNVQETDVGSSNQFMRGQLGSTGLQFMGFVTGAQEQQYARMNRRMVQGMGAETSSVIMGQILMASLVTTARTHVAASGRSDEKQYLKDNLSPESLVMNAIGYTGAFGTLGMVLQIPDKVNRGFGSSIISNPVAGYIDGVGRVLTSMFDNGELTESQWRSVFSMLPFLSQAYLQTGLNELANELGD
tara:strand:+ start:220 stop:3378 length:3159 start_codon:yes stop_codon:yes gene_type:complete